MGVTVCCASGDGGSSDGQTDGLAHVDFPASSPFALGCGGTQLISRNGAITSEVVWNNGSAGGATGGGISDVFPLPDWQIGAPNGPGRMVPDVAANADPNTGYNVVVHGQVQPIGGTSAVAPLYAGLFAAFGKKLGFITPEMYLNPVCFNDITQGDNGAFRAGVGPDPCTGIGSPIGVKLANLFTHPAANATRALKIAQAENARLRKTIAQLQAT